jgi:ribosomal protein S18 acetylase RimI-like enzyme
MFKLNQVDFKMYKANLNDVDKIAEIRLVFLQELDVNLSNTNYQKLFEQTKEYFVRKMQADELHTWFILDKEKIVTSGSLLINEMPPTIEGYGGGLEAYLFNVYTLPEYRRKGLAKKLTQEMLNEAKLRQCNRIWLMASDDYAAGIYTGLGFQHRDDVMELIV